MERNPLKSAFVFVLGVLAVIYLIYPSAGIFELIPDIIPVVGNLDEATAVLILTNALAYYGIDVTRWFGRKFPQGQVVQEPRKR